MAQRWIRQSRAPEPDPAEGIGRLGSTLRRLRLPITAAGERRLRRWLFVIVLLVAFVAGLLVRGVLW